MDVSTAQTARAWLARPFSEHMDLTEWALFAVVIATIVYVWIRIMYHIEAA